MRGVVHLYQAPMSTQPGHPFMGRWIEYQLQGGDALQLGSKGRYGSCVGGNSSSSSHGIFRVA